MRGQIFLYQHDYSKVLTQGFGRTRPKNNDQSNSPASNIMYSLAPHLKPPLRTHYRFSREYWMSLLKLHAKLQDQLQSNSLILFTTRVKRQFLLYLSVANQFEIEFSKLHQSFPLHFAISDCQK